MWPGGEGNGNPLQYSCLENSVDRGARWAAVLGVAQSRTQLKRFSMHVYTGEGNGNPLQYSCLENPRDRGAWWAVVYGVTQSRTRLKRLSSSSSVVSSVNVDSVTQSLLPHFWPGQHIHLADLDFCASFGFLLFSLSLSVRRGGEGGFLNDRQSSKQSECS